MVKEYGKSKTRNMELPAVKGATPRAFETHPRSKPKPSIRDRGAKSTIKDQSWGKVPNK